MDKQSLDEAYKLIENVIFNSNIKEIDKYELLLNITYLFSDYEKSIKCLIKNRNDEIRRNK